MTAKKRDTSEDGYNKTFPRILRELIEKNNTTIQAVANQIGITRQAVSQYCNGETQPNGETLLKIADYFGVSCDYLLRGVSAENIEMHEQLGLSDDAIEVLKAVKNIDKISKFEHSTCDLISDVVLLLKKTSCFQVLRELSKLRDNLQTSESKESICDFEQLMRIIKFENQSKQQAFETVFNILDSYDFEFISPKERRIEKARNLIDVLGKEVENIVIPRDELDAVEKIASVLSIRDSISKNVSHNEHDKFSQYITIFDYLQALKGESNADDNETE